MNKAETIKLLGIIHAFFPNKDESKEQTQAKVNGWHIMLEDMPYELAEQALKAVLAKTRFFPTIAEIRDEAANIARPTPSAGDAWQEVLAAFREYGHYQTPVFSDPLILRAVNSMGWYDMCMSEQPDILRAQFNKTYDAITKREKETYQIPESVHKAIAAAKHELDKPQLKALE